MLPQVECLLSFKNIKQCFLVKKKKINKSQLSENTHLKAFYPNHLWWRRQKDDIVKLLRLILFLSEFAWFLCHNCGQSNKFAELNSQSKYVLHAERNYAFGQEIPLKEKLHGNPHFT